ncbi:MAG: hypothetical protein IJ401_05310, partial [Oscillospiraceae bacterium]|nr:hypothetical protein [Oscillospiraceae bacterium]
MYTKTSESFNKKVQGLSRTFSAKLDFDNLSITDGIRKISVSGGSNVTGALAIGVTVCACVEIEISGTVAVSDNQMFSLSFGLQLGENDFEFIPYGKYIVNSVEITEEKDTKITAYDLMFLAEKTYNSTLEYPTTSLKMIDEICSKIGVSRTDEDLTAISIPNAPIGYTMREILGYLAGLYGKFAVIDREGKLQIKWYEQNGAVLDYDHIKEPKLGETNYSLDSISILNGETVVFSVGSGNGISCENPYMTSSVLNRIWSQLKGFSFTPAQVEVLIADPRLDVWDMITLQDAEFPCMELRLEYDGGVSASVTASAESTTEGNVGYRSPETIEKQRIKQDLLDLGKIVAEKATIADLEVTNSFISRVESTANE